MMGREGDGKFDMFSVNGCNEMQDDALASRCQLDTSL
jgi:hypothetical protein